MTAALFLTNVIAWGFTWIAIAFQLKEAPVEVAIAYRFILACLLLFSILALTRRLRPIPLREQPYLALVGLCMFCLNFVFIYLGTGYIASGLVALLFSMATIFNAANSALFYGDRPSPRLVGGAVLGIAGLALIFAHDLVGLTLRGTVLGAALVLCGTYCFSLGNMAARRNMHLDLPSATAWSMAWGSGFLVLYALARGQSFPTQLSPRFLIALAYLALVGSVVGFLAYLELVRRLGASKAAFATIVYPIIALAVSTVVEGYRWTPLAAGGLLFVLAGNALVFMPAGLMPKAWMRVGSRSGGH